MLTVAAPLLAGRSVVGERDGALNINQTVPDATVPTPSPSTSVNVGEERSCRVRRNFPHHQLGLVEFTDFPLFPRATTTFPTVVDEDLFAERMCSGVTKEKCLCEFPLNSDLARPRVSDRLLQFHKHRVSKISIEQSLLPYNLQLIL